MVQGVPYIVTRGSANLELRRGDRVELVPPPGELWAEVQFLQVTRKQVQYRHLQVRTAYSFEVEVDRAEILERLAKMDKARQELAKWLDGE